MMSTNHSFNRGSSGAERSKYTAKEIKGSVDQKSLKQYHLTASHEEPQAKV